MPSQLTIEEINVNETLSEMTPTASKRNLQQQQATNETTINLDICESDGEVVITETETVVKQPHKHHKHHHKHHHQHKQESPVPPPLPQSAPPQLTPTAELTQLEWHTDLDADELPPQQSAPTVIKLNQPSTQCSELPQAAATAAANPTTTNAPQPATTAAINAELLLVGVVTADTSDKYSRSYRVSTDLPHTQPQQPKKRCCCSKRCCIS
ncbi:transcription factor Sox-1-like isoform X1 [Drosophila busckii]|uniref:transcription factor Sox-1-like isoform X1 n=1 Tax=Drosophila busckii TaxID=30019 RepID=UPI00083EA0BC|nr:transcription factor Sox-1-like isoform X1 [Drosophila busckii]